MPAYHRHLANLSKSDPARKAPRFPVVFRRGIIATLVWTPIHAGCSATRHTPESGPQLRQVSRGLDESDRYLSRSPAPTPGLLDRPAAIIDGQPLPWAEIAPALAEAAGSQVIEEWALDRRLAARCAAAGLVIGEPEIEAERARVIQAITPTGPAELGAEALVERVRRQRGLGPVRFAALLKRNAMLRALVSDQVRINEASIAQAYALRYGDTFRARLVTTATAAEATRAAERIAQGEPFSRVAAEMSTDPSAARGGVIDPISPVDPAYPKAVRDTLASLAPGTVSSPISLEGTYAIVILDERLAPADPPGIEDVRPQLERDARGRQERLLMDQLARQLGSGSGIRAVDPALRWSIEGR